MQVDWTVITILVITFSALNGLFKGWWKEAITSFMLALLLFLLQQPNLAAQVVTWLNSALNMLLGLLNPLLSSVFPLSTETIQLSPNDPLTWLLILFVTLGIASLLSRLMLPGGRLSGGYYAVRPIGHILGFALGAFNGFLILSLAREYLDGRALPGNAPAATASTAGVTVISGSPFGQPAATVSVQAVGLPNFTIMDSMIPWVVVAFGLFLLVVLVRTRMMVESQEGAGRRVSARPPFGYKKMG